MALQSSVSAARLRDPETVWVVDDSPTMREQLSGALLPHYHVKAFPDGETLLEAMAGVQPDVLVLDWQLPGISGLEVVSFVRRSADELTLPVLMLTSMDTRDDFAAGLSAGANDYLAKPYHREELLSRVKSLMRVSRMTTELREAQHRMTRALAREVTLRDEAETARRKAAASEDLLRMVVEISGTGTWVLDPATNDVQADERFRHLFGLRAGERFTLARGLAIIHPGDSARVAAAVSDALAGKNGGKYLEEYRTVQPDGSVRWLEARGHLTKSAEGKSAQLVGTGIDISPRKAAEAARENLLLAAEQLAHEAQERSEFEQQLIGIVSHDLRNPVSAIIMAASMVQRRGDLDERQQKGLDRIATSASRAERMIRDLLDFTQARLGGGLHTKPIPSDLHSLMREVVDEARVSRPGRSIELEHSGDGSGTWDPDRIEQLAGNLLSNALHYSPPGSAVSVRTRGDGGDVVLEVHNGGEAIPPETLGRLFEPMQRGGSTDHHTRSVGLGLYIVKSIVEAHRGAVTVDSSEGRGTTFSVRLPRVVA